MSISFAEDDAFLLPDIEALLGHSLACMRAYNLAVPQFLTPQQGCPNYRRGDDHEVEK